MSPAIISTRISENGSNKSNRRIQAHLAPDQYKRNEVCIFILRNRINALLVDGDRCSRMIQKGLLRSYGVETQAVDSIQAAIDLLMFGSTFNLIIIDLVLPGVYEFEAIRTIRAMCIPTKLVAMNIAWTDTDRQAVLDAGVNQAIDKPLSPENLLPILMELYD